MSGANREYRDRLFKFIFGKEENKAWTLSLYNAVNGSNHRDASSITLTTVSDAVYMGMKNDVSFLVSGTMNLYEQQRTYNPNMPMRFLIYAGQLYSKYIELGNNKCNLYSSTQQVFPSPRCICFYNGEEEKDDMSELYLSSSFKEKSDIEVTVTMININYGRNRELFDRCEPLKEYSWFTDRVNINQNEMGNLEAAIDAALEEMPKDFVIREFLIANKAEVKRMCITEYDEARTMSLFKEEGRQEGREEGVEEGTIKTLAGLVDDGLLSEGKAAEKANMTVEEFRENVMKYCH